MIRLYPETRRSRSNAERAHGPDDRRERQQPASHTDIEGRSPGAFEVGLPDAQRDHRTWAAVNEIIEPNTYKSASSPVLPGMMRMQAMNPKTMIET